MGDLRLNTCDAGRGRWRSSMATLLLVGALMRISAEMSPNVLLPAYLVDAAPGCARRPLQERWGERRESNPRSPGPQPGVLTPRLRPPRWSPIVRDAGGVGQRWRRSELWERDGRRFRRFGGGGRRATRPTRPPTLRRGLALAMRVRSNSPRATGQAAPPPRLRTRRPVLLRLSSLASLLAERGRSSPNRARVASVA